MKLKLFSTKLITIPGHESLIAELGCYGESGYGHVTTTFSVELKNQDFANMTLAQIESLAITCAESILRQ